MAGTIQAFPTCVGVNPGRVLPAKLVLSFPHVRGGEPDVSLGDGVANKLSPRAWG